MRRLIVIAVFFIVSFTLTLGDDNGEEGGTAVEPISGVETDRIDGIEFQVQQSVCQRISEPICQTSLYNYTFMPNEWGQMSQESSAAQIKRLSWILRSKCSPILPIFMCVFFFPICSEKSVGKLVNYRVIFIFILAFSFPV